MRKVALLCLLMVVLCVLGACGGGIDYAAQIRDSLDAADPNWNAVFRDVRVDGLHAVFMCSDQTYMNIKGEPHMVEELAQLCLDVTVSATGGDLTRADLIGPDGRWLADADLETLSGNIVVENYVLTGKVMVYPDDETLFK